MAKLNFIQTARPAPGGKPDGAVNQRAAILEGGGAGAGESV